MSTCTTNQHTARQHCRVSHVIGDMRGHEGMQQFVCSCSPTFSSACLADTVGTPITRSAGAERPRVYVPSFSSSMPGCSTDSSR